MVDANWLLIIIFICATALMGLLTAMVAGRRVATERRQFRMAVKPDTTETPRYWLLGIVPGIMLSGLLLLTHTWLTPASIFGLGIIGLILAMLPQYLPVLLGLTGLIVAVVPNGVWQPLLHTTRVPLISWAPNFAIIVGALTLLAAVSDIILPFASSPRLFSRHGRTWVQYVVQQRVWLPLVVPIPYRLVSNIAWWPHISLGGTTIALTLLPAFLGLGFRHRQPSAQVLLRRDAWTSGIVGLATLVLGILGRAGLLGAGMVLLMVAEVSLFGLIVCLMARYQRPAIAPAAGGVRVLAVQAGTPAAKMQLRPGDTILQCNGRDVPSSSDLYAATQNLGTFCHLRVRGFDGQIRLTETAIFQGAPHMLGIITFPEED